MVEIRGYRETVEKVQQEEKPYKPFQDIFKKSIQVSVRQWLITKKGKQ